MEAINAAAGGRPAHGIRDDDRPSSSRPYGERNPDLPSLDRIVVGRRHAHLDLAWQGFSREPGGCRPACVLLRGHPIAPPAPRSYEKGKEALRALGGLAAFKWIAVDATVYQLAIEQPGMMWTTYYCNTAEPPNQNGWQRSYRTYTEALACLRSRFSDAPDDASPPSRWQLAEPAPGALPVATVQRSAPSAPHSAAPPEIRPAPALRAVPRPVCDVYTSEEARRQVRRLGKDLDPGHEIVWAGYRGRNLFSVVMSPRAGWDRLWRDKARTYDVHVHHAALHEPWECYDAQVLGGGPFPPTRPGQSTTVESYGDADDDDGIWTLEWGVMDDGRCIADLNTRPLAVVALGKGG